VKRVDAKRPPLRLDTHSYRQLHRQVLERNGWRCQLCGSMKLLQVHHRQLRSHSGSDIEDNLITLCELCHSLVHHENGFRSSE
jgi:5-methylcytosine-specific restriction endonuclease McrA